VSGTVVARFESSWNAVRCAGFRYTHTYQVMFDVLSICTLILVGDVYGLFAQRDEQYVCLESTNIYCSRHEVTRVYESTYGVVPGRKHAGDKKSGTLQP